MYPIEVIEEVDSAREESGRVQQDMRQEDDVCWAANDLVGQFNIWVDDLCLEFFADVSHIP